MALLTPEIVFRKWATAGVPESGEHDPLKSEIIQLLNMLFGVSRGGWVVAKTLSELIAISPENATDGGVVLTGAGAGYYDRDGSVWVFGRGFPDTFARVALAGSGTAQTGAIGAGVNPALIEVFFAKVATPNTGPLTLSISGGPARQVRNLAGSALSAGEWTGIVMFYINDADQYQLLLDAGAAASAAASAATAQFWATQAEAAALPDGVVTRLKLSAPLAAGISVNVREVGAVGNGAINDRAAFVSADAQGAFTVSAGTYLISTNLTIVNDVQFLPGAKLSIPAGVTLTFNGAIIANAAQIFQTVGTGNVVINPTKTDIARAEWWGAKPNNSGFDSWAAIQAAYEAHPRVVLLGGTYYTSKAIRMSRSGTSIAGQFFNNVTILMVTSATEHCIHIEPLSFTPGTTSTYINDVEIKDLALYRSVTPTAAALEKDAPTGVRMIGVVRPALEHVWCNNSMLGFYARNTINASLFKCTANNSLSTGFFFGFYWDGLNAGAEDQLSSNASTYFTDCIASAPNMETSIGFEIFGRFSDQFLLRPETGLIKWGIRVRGTSDFSVADSRLEVDVHIIDPIFDGIKNGGVGLQVSGTVPYGAVSIKGGYAAPFGGATCTGVLLYDAQGVTMSGGFQFIGWPSSGFTGLYVENSVLNQMSDLYFQDCSASAVITGGAMNKIEGSIYNHLRSNGAVGVDLLNTAGRNKIDVGIHGVNAGKFALGVRIASGCTSNEVNLTRINTGAVTTRVEISSVGYSTAGTYSSNLVTGI